MNSIWTLFFFLRSCFQFTSCCLSYKSWILEIKSNNKTEDKTLNQRLITIQIKHFMSVFQDFGVFVHNNPQEKAQRSSAQAALNYKTIKREHALACAELWASASRFLWTKSLKSWKFSVFFFCSLFKGFVQHILCSR